MARMELFKYSFLVITTVLFLTFNGANDLPNRVSLIFWFLYKALLSQSFKTIFKNEDNLIHGQEIATVSNFAAQTF